MTELIVYVPHPDSDLRHFIDEGAAICGGAERGDGRVEIDFESNRYGAENMKTYEDKLLHAADRHVTRYPTVARRLVGLSDVIAVGTYDVEGQILYITQEKHLLGWTGEDGYPGA